MTHAQTRTHTRTQRTCSLRAVFLTIIVLTMMGACTKKQQPFTEDTTVPTGNQVAVSATLTTKSALIKQARIFTNILGPENWSPSDPGTGRWESNRSDYDPTKTVQDNEYMMLDLDNGEIGYGRYEDYGKLETITLDEAEVLKRGAKFFTDAGLNLEDFTLEIAGLPERIGPGYTVYANRKNSNLDSLAELYFVEFYKNYEVVDFRYAVFDRIQIGVTTPMTAEDAIAADPVANGTPLTGKPIPTTFSQPLTNGVSLLIPGYTLPIMENITTMGPSVLALPREELQRLTNEALKIPNPNPKKKRR